MNLPNPVNSLEAFRGSTIDGDRFVYPNLQQAADTFREEKPGLWETLYHTEHGSMDEAYVLNCIQTGRMVLTAAQLSVLPPHDDRLQELSHEFTSLSRELYGAPDPEHAAGIARNYMYTYAKHDSDPAVDQEHLDVVLNHLDEALSKTDLGKEPIPDITQHMPEMSAALLDLYREPLSVFDEIKDTDEPIDPDQIQQLYEEAHRILAEQSKEWEEASVSQVSGSSMSSDSRDLTIKIGRDGTYSGRRVFGLYIHEGVIHLGKALSGKSLGSVPLRYGTPDYLAAEEGQTIYFDEATGTRVGEQYQDYYLNIAMALGDFGRPAMKRIDFQKYYTSKLIVAQQLRDTRPDAVEQAEKKALRHAKRIYRGTLGNDITGVNTRDSSYRRGPYDIIAPYVAREIQRGVASHDLITYILQGKFDPTKQFDRNYVESLPGRSIVL